MNNPISLVPPIINILVLASFTTVVLRQYLRRQRPYQLYWTLGLLMALFGTGAYVAMILVGPTSHAGIILFRSYYILGAALAPVWLGLGSVALVTGPRTTKLSLTALYILTALTVAFLSAAQINLTKLAVINGTPGAGIFVPGPWRIMIIIMNSLGVLTVAGVAIYSGRNLLKRQMSTGDFSTFNLLIGNILILVGDFINGGAGVLAGILNIGSGFWIIMAIGWAVFFEGVLLVSRRRARAITTTPKEDQKPEVTMQTARILTNTPNTARSEEPEQASTISGENTSEEGQQLSSAAENALTRELEQTSALFLASPLVRLGAPVPEEREARAVGFLICSEGKWGLLEIDTEQATLSAAGLSRRDRRFRSYGLRVIEHYPAENCQRDPHGVVTEFLEQLKLNG